jgi:hypothetical protein
MRPARHVTRARFRGRGIRRSLLQSPCDWTSQFLCLSEARKLENKLKRQGRGSGFYSITGIPRGSKSDSRRIVGSEPSEARQTDRRSAPQGCGKAESILPPQSIFGRLLLLSSQRCEPSVWSLATLCIHPQRQQTPRSLETLMIFRLAHPKRHLLVFRRASTISTNSRPE